MAAVGDGGLDITKALSAKSANLSPQQRALATWLVRHESEAAYLPANRIAQQAGVSQATVIRFAQLLGYEGFPGFQDAVRDLVQSRYTTIERLESAEQTKSPGANGTVYHVFAQVMANLKRTVEQIPASSFDEAVTDLHRAHRVIVTGAGGAAGPAMYFGYSLSLIRKHVHLAVGGQPGSIEAFVRFDAEDLLVAFAFPRYTERTLQAMRIARESGGRVLCLTDSAAAPPAALGDVVLAAAIDATTFQNSYVAAMALCEALLASVALADLPGTVTALSEWERWVERFSPYQPPEADPTWRIWLRSTTADPGRSR